MQDSGTASVSSRNLALWTLLIIIGAVTYLAGFNFPSALQVENQFLGECPYEIYRALEYNCEEFNTENHPILNMELINMTKANEFFQLKVFPILDKTKTMPDKVTLSVEVSSFGVTEIDVIKKFYSTKVKKDLVFDCTLGGDHECEAETIEQILELEDYNYVVVVKLTQIDQIKNQNIEDFRFAFVTPSTTFRTYVTYLKWIFFAASLIGFVYYRFAIAAIPKGYTTDMQDYIGFMGLIAILFTQPFIHYSYLEDKFYAALVGIFITALQGTTLILFWLTLVERLSSSEFKITDSGKRVIQFVGAAHFVVTIAGYALILQEQSQDPLLTVHNAQGAITSFFRIYLWTFVAVIGLWTAIRLFRIGKRLSELDWRDGTAFNFSICYILCYLFFIFTGNQQTVSFDGPKIVLLLGITTLYTLLLEVLYAPFEHEIEEAEKRRKYQNPDAVGQYGDLDASSDTGTPSQIGKHDNVKLRDADALKKSTRDYDDDA